MRKDLVLRSALLAFLALGSASHPASADSDPYEDSVDRTAADFQTAAQSVQEAEAHVRQAREAMAAAYEKVKSSPLDPAQKKAALAKIREVSKTLQKYDRPLKRFTDAAAPVTRAQEVWQDLNELQETVEKDRASQGALAGDMRMIAKVMSDLGSEVPVIGGFVEAYGKMTDGMLDATGRVAEKLAAERNQGMVGGAGVYSAGETREKSSALKAKYPDLFDDMTFEPSQPPWVYTPIGQERKPQLVWDGKGWEKVPEDADAVAIFRMSLRAGRRPDPAALLTLCKHWDRGRVRQEAAGEILDAIDALRGSANSGVQDAFNDAYFRSNQLFEVLEAAVDDPDVFRARYMYDPDSFSGTHAFLGRLYKGLTDRKADPKVLAKLAALARKYGIQDVLKQVPEETPSLNLECAALSIDLRAPVLVESVEATGQAPAATREEMVNLRFSFRDSDGAPRIPFTGRVFERAFRKEAGGVASVHRVSGRLAPDQSAIEELTVSFDHEPSHYPGHNAGLEIAPEVYKNPRRTLHERWSVTMANIPLFSSDAGLGALRFAVQVRVGAERPQGFAITRAEYLSTTEDTWTQNDADGRPVEKRQSRRAGGLDVSRLSSANARLNFAPPKR
ncbi:MAG: hypothetical protein HY924_12085 [Elusimicrobia bacterium]|nr:hypothetical protein [Elusimicrobiota bacterium]